MGEIYDLGLRIASTELLCTVNGLAGVVKIQDLQIFNRGKNRPSHKFFRILYSEVNKMQYFPIIHTYAGHYGIKTRPRDRLIVVCNFLCRPI